MSSAAVVIGALRVKLFFQNNQLMGIVCFMSLTSIYICHHLARVRGTVKNIAHFFFDIPERLE